MVYAGMADGARASNWTEDHSNEFQTSFGSIADDVLRGVYDRGKYSDVSKRAGTSVGFTEAQAC
jgi:hypothetical protein